MRSPAEPKLFPMHHFEFRPGVDYARFCRVGLADTALYQAIEHLRDVWLEVQSSRDRDAIYEYLKYAYELVRCWAVERQEIQRARRALKINGLAPPLEPDPFAAVIAASMAPGQLDRRQLSKYSRVLRFAAACDCHPKQLRRFIKTRWGGINDCAAEHSRRLRRQ